MRATRRFWGVAGLAVLLAGFAALLERPVLLAGTASLAAWLLAHQYRFLSRLSREMEAMEIAQTISRNRVSDGGSTAYSLSVSRPGSAALPLSIEAGPPLAATAEGESRTVSLSPGQQDAGLGLTLSWPVAGRFECDPATVEASDPTGLFSETLSLGSTPSVTVEPRRPQNIHVGAGGEEMSPAYGDHESDQTGSGFDPAEIRKYVPGDSAARIDWNVTARLGELHVRQFEAETERQTALVFDHRPAIGMGPDGATKLDYLRHVALAFVSNAREFSDPLGCYTVGEEGLTTRYPPMATTENHSRVRRTVENLRVTPGDPNPVQTDSGDPTDGDGPRSHRPTSPNTPATARRLADRLEDDHPFDLTLRPFLAATDPYVRRISGDPLFETTRSEVGRLDGTVWTVILTDDSNRTRLRETITAARGSGSHALVFLAPTVLFEPGALADLEAARDRYVEFEEFRRTLASLSRVSAFEVAPGDRLDAVLASGRRRSEQRNAGRA